MLHLIVGFGMIVACAGPPKQNTVPLPIVLPTGDRGYSHECNYPTQCFSDLGSFCMSRGYSSYEIELMADSSTTPKVGFSAAMGCELRPDGLSKELCLVREQELAMASSRKLTLIFSCNSNRISVN
jgi:hypothetical protein